MEIRHINAKAKDNHLSLKNIKYENFSSSIKELTNRINSLDIDKRLKDKYKNNLLSISKDKNTAKNIKNLAASINTDIDKISKGAYILDVTDTDGSQHSEVLTQDEISKRLKDFEKANKKVEELKRRKQEHPEDFKSQEQLDAELEKAKAESEKGRQFGADCVKVLSEDSVNIAKGLLTGSDEERAKAMIDAIGSVAGLFTKGIRGAFWGIKGSIAEAKAGKQFSKEEIDNMQKITTNIDSIRKEITKESVPATDEEMKEITDSMAQEDFEKVGKITDWDSAFKYGYAKLKQIHGEKYDESKAKACLEGLKKKYPDNPMVVVGALKYGGHKSDDEDKKGKNSRVFVRQSNGRVLRIVDNSKKS